MCTCWSGCDCGKRKPSGSAVCVHCRVDAVLPEHAAHTPATLQATRGSLHTGTCLSSAHPVVPIQGRALSSEMPAAGADPLAVLSDASCSDEAVVAALVDLRQQLEPLLALGKQANTDVLRPLARSHGRLVTGLVAAASSSLAARTRPSSKRAAALGEAACLGLDALDCLRPCLKASQQELDSQRYGFLRKLVALNLNECAWSQGQLLHASVSVSGGGTDGPGDLHVGAVVNLLVAGGELLALQPERGPALWTSAHAALQHLLALSR
jgi:separase